MHYELLVEDVSGKKMLDEIIPRILGEAHTYKVISYKGVGRLPKDLAPGSDANKRILLDQLPRLLTGYGKTFAGYGPHYQAAVIVVCDLDRRSRDDFEEELRALVARVDPCPEHAFCLAIEEGEAWLLGDIPAIKLAYPRAKDTVLNGYVNDSICGTWELLADALFAGGAEALKVKGWKEVGTEKSRWAEAITPHMVLDENLSPSFNNFVATLKQKARS
jgi:hypothetical protein